MAEQNQPRITERELREAEVQMTDSPPVATGFVGFVPVLPDGYTPLTTPLGETVPSVPPPAAGNGARSE